MLGGHLNHSSNTTLATAMAGALDLFPETPPEGTRGMGLIREMQMLLRRGPVQCNPA